MSLRTHARLLLSALLVSVTGVVTAEEEPHQAAHLASPDYYTVLKENNQVLVLKMVLEAEVPDGHVVWHQAWTHRVTNVGDDTVIAIIVEDKP